MKTAYKTIIFVLVTAITISLAGALPCWAAEEESDFEWERPRERGRRFELTEERIERILNRLREAEPERAEELEQLQEEDPEAFKAELKKMMRDQREKFRDQRRRMGGPDSQGGPDFHRGPGGPGHGRGGPGGPGMRGDGKYGEYLKWLQENYPERAERLTEMKERMPEAYEKRMRFGQKRHKRIYEAAKKHPELAETLKADLELKQKRDEVLEKIKAATSDEDKEQLATELEQVIGQRFDLIVKRKQMKYEILREKLEKMKEKVKASEAQVGKWKDASFKSENVKARVESLLGQTEKFNWE